MIELAQAALDHHGVDDTLEAVGQFAPRGQSGAMFAGHAGSSASSGLPPTVMVAVSASTVYGMHARTRRDEPDDILFAVPRARLAAKVHQRVNVRVLELIDEQTGARIELEGNRLPVTHSKDVIHVLTEAPGSEPR